MNYFAANGTLLRACLSVSECMMLEGIKTDKDSTVRKSIAMHRDNLFDDGSYLRRVGDDTKRQKCKMKRSGALRVALIKDGEIVESYESVHDAASHVSVSVATLRSRLSARIDGWLPDGFVMRYETDIDSEGTDIASIGAQGPRLSGVTLEVKGVIYRREYRREVERDKREINIYVNGEVVKTYKDICRFVCSNRRMKAMGTVELKRLISGHIDGWHFADTKVRFAGDEDLSGTKCGKDMMCHIDYADRVRQCAYSVKDKAQERMSAEGMSIKAAALIGYIEDKAELSETEAEIDSLMQRWRDGEITTAERNERLGWLQNHANVLRRRMSGGGRKYGIAECYLASKYDPYY